MAEEVRQGNFREDLYYHLLGLDIQLPPLRERGNDVLLLAKLFMKEYCLTTETPQKSLSAPAQQQLLKYAWPGNLRELKAVIELACVMANNQLIEPEHLQFNTTTDLTSLFSKELKLEDYNNLIIRHFLDKYNRNVVLTAQKLGIGKSTIYRLIQENKV